MMENDKVYKPYVSIFLVAANVCLFLSCLLMGEKIYALGQLSLIGVLGRGELWRVFSSMFLHANFMHLINNMMVLFFLGGMIEETLGHVSYGIVYMLSGLGGSVLSLLHKLLTLDCVPSVGASGALFGLDGVLLSMVLFLPGYRNKVSFVRVIMMILLSLYSGFSSYRVDNAAHVGGLLTGFFAGMIVCLIKRRKGNYHIEH